MSGSRIRERARLGAPVVTTDPAALTAYASALRPVVANLRALAEDATARPSQRVHSRTYLRRDMLKGSASWKPGSTPLRPEQADPAGAGGSPPY